MEIEQRLKRNGLVRILEVGCGHGVALLELCRLYGERVQLFGINKSPEHGDEGLMKAIAVDRGFFSKKEIEQVKLPIIYYFDINHKWPLPDNTFDIIYSQVAFIWFEDKIHALEEIDRVLKPDGAAAIDMQLKPREFTQPDKSPILIHEEEKIIPLDRFFRAFPSIRIIIPPQTKWERIYYWVSKKLGRKRQLPKKRNYLKLEKTESLDFNLEFIRARSYSRRAGCQSLYRIKRLAAENRTQ